MITAAIERIEDASGLAALRPEWDALWRRVPDASPFLSPTWLLAWWRQFGTARPLVAALRLSDRLAGVLPCYVFAEDGRGKLLPMGVSLSDHFDALLAPEAPPDAATRLLASLLEAADVSVCDLTELPPGAALLDAETPPSWWSDTQRGQPCPVLSLPEQTSLEQIVPAKTRRKLRMNRHRAERIGGWTTRWAEASNVSDAIDTLEHLHQARWQSRGEPGVLADARVQRFYRDVAPELLTAGHLAIASLRIEGQVAASFMALRSTSRLFLYLSGFAEQFAFVSPGSLLLGDALEFALRDGMREIHFLRGGEAYKYAWGGVDRFNTTRRFQRS